MKRILWVALFFAVFNVFSVSDYNQQLNNIKNNKTTYSTTNKIPIVFSFDEKYKLPASVAISSLVKSKSSNTEYEIFVLHDNTLSAKTKKTFEKIHPIRWIYVDNSMFNKYPYANIYPKVVLWRLIIPYLIPDRDKIIYSDVDVLFKGDLSDVYKTNIKDYYWGGVIAEKNVPPTVCHKYYPENKNEYIFWAGFMLINADKMRKDQMIKKFYMVAKAHKDLRHKDLDILNIACNKIKPLPLDYCYFQELFDVDDVKYAFNYRWLKSVYSDKELTLPKITSKIIHFPNTKIWAFKRNRIPDYYWYFLEDSPFFNPDNHKPTAWDYIKNFLINITYKTVIFFRTNS